MTATMYPTEPAGRGWWRRPAHEEQPGIDRDVPLFSHLSNRRLRKLDGLYEVISVPTGHYLVNAGHTGREFIVILAGSAVVVAQGERARVLHAGDHVGEISLLRRFRREDTRRTATVQTTSPTTIASFTARNFERMLERCPHLRPDLEHDVRERLGRDAVVRAA